MSDEHGKVVVDERRLQEYVVRLLSPNTGATIGTGFFVGPSLILTNSHVVQGITSVGIRWEAAPGGRWEGTGTVLAASPARTDDQPLWPFPDLALIETTDLADNECVLIENTPTLASSNFGSGFTLWGYPQRGSERHPAGDPAKSSVVGHGSSSSPYLRVSGDWIGRGMSGSPCVSHDRGTVAGIVAGTLSPHHTDGGWFTLLAEAAHFPDEQLPSNEQKLTARLRSIIQTSQAAITAQPQRWSRVISFTMPTTPRLGAPKEPYQRRELSSPAELLLADNTIIDYLFYGDVLDAAEQWAYGPEPLRLATITGSGGTGKSRFARELAIRLTTNGWFCGEYRELGPSTLPLSRARVPRFITVDYAENLAPEVDILLKWLQQGVSPTAPARVLLLSREPTEPTATGGTPRSLPDSTDANVRAVIADRWPITTTVRPLTPGERQHLYEAAVDALSRAWNHTAGTVEQIDLHDQQYETALGVTYAALDTVLRQEMNANHPSATETHSSAATETPADRVLGHEARYWSLTAPTGISDKQVAQAMAIATLFRGDTTADLIAILEACGWTAVESRELGAWAGRYYGGGPQVAPLRPDRLGERLIERALLLDQAAPSLARLFQAATTTQCAHAINTLARAATYSTTAQHALKAVVQPLLLDLATRATTPTPDGPLPGKGALAVALVDLLVGPHGGLITNSGSP